MSILGRLGWEDFGDSTLPAPVLPAKDTSTRALEAEIEMLTSQRDAERQRAAEARRREMAAVAESRKVRAEAEARVQKIVESASFALDEAKRRITTIGRGTGNG